MTLRYQVCILVRLKSKGGLENRKNYNVGYGEGRVAICPADKEEIKDAFKHFRLIYGITIKNSAALFEGHFLIK